eukprot:33250-Chlamydomonas_euryale.AAC.5
MVFEVWTAVDSERCHKSSTSGSIVQEDSSRPQHLMPHLDHCCSSGASVQTPPHFHTYKQPHHWRHPRAWLTYP